jgi:hypothetical protein
MNEKEIIDAQQKYIEQLEAALIKLTDECLASDFNEHWDSYLDALKLLADNA